MKKCSKCRIARYCSPKCQAKDWADVHQLECKYFKIDSEAYSGYLFKGDSIRLLLRVLLMNKKCPQKVTEEVETFYGKRSFDTLLSHTDKIFNEPNERSEQGHDLAVFFRNLGIELDMEYFRDIYGKIAINSFGTYNYFLNKTGTALYIGCSVFNHSCSNNACHIFDGIKMQVRAIKEFDTENEAITISYINPRLSRQERLDALAESYYFRCKCPRCENPNEEEDAQLIKSEEELKNFMQLKDPQLALKAGLKFLEFFTPCIPGPTAVETYVLDRIAYLCENIGDERASFFREEWRKNFLITHGREPQEFLEANRDPALIYNDP